MTVEESNAESAASLSSCHMGYVVHYLCPLMVELAAPTSLVLRLSVKRDAMLPDAVILHLVGAGRCSRHCKVEAHLHVAP